MKTTRADETCLLAIRTAAATRLGALAGQQARGTVAAVGCFTCSNRPVGAAFLTFSSGWRPGRIRLCEGVLRLRSTTPGPCYKTLGAPSPVSRTKFSNGEHVYEAPPPAYGSTACDPMSSAPSS